MTSDVCNAMVRLKHATAEFFLPQPHIFYVETHFCAAHGIHNIATKCAGESGLVGHAHACTFVMSIDGRRRQLRRALHQIVEQELVCHNGPPPAAYVEHARGCVDITLLRARELIQATAQTDFEKGFCGSNTT